MKQILKHPKNEIIFNFPVKLSNGDLQILKDHEKKGIEGVICGRAIYEGKIDLLEANEIFKLD